MSDELKSWGHPGGGNNQVILKCDNESSIKVLRDTIGRYLGGIVTPENPAKGRCFSREWGPCQHIGHEEFLF